MNGTELIRFINASFPQYKGMLYFSLTDLAKIYMRGNRDKMRAFIAEHSIAPYFGDNGHNLYCIYEVQEAAEKTRWRS